MEEKLYQIYKYIIDTNTITEEMSLTKKIMLELMGGNENTLKYCKKKMKEEKKEVEDAMLGNHFHENMTKREILVNELSQYMYWQIVLDVSQNVSYKETNIFKNMERIIEKIDISKIEETRLITLNEVINHDLENMKNKKYLLEVI